MNSQRDIIRILSHHAIVIGSGAAGFNAINRLFDHQVKDIALITEGLKMGTSRNTGSDKQTYYKLSLASTGTDSVQTMAESLYQGGLMDGKHALIEAASSARSFYNLVELGVLFPHNPYGEYVGYKTDHDNTNRASSMGPKTSKAMVEALERKTLKQGITIHDKLQLIDLIIENETIKGVLCLDKTSHDVVRYTVIYANHVILATGGPADLYQASVYPKSQHGALGIALHRGVKAKNLTEFQYGIASVKFRWNLSGSYQQVLPTYVSYDASMQDRRILLSGVFSCEEALLEAIFKKGYQWPFDVRKLENEGSSLIDLMIMQEKQQGRRVFLDFLTNPVESYESYLTEEVKTYLSNSKAFGERPIDRLQKMNPMAIALFLENGIDLYQEMLEIDVCAQHLNGGLWVDEHYETSVKHLYAIGETAATHGIYRPGGSALNAGQVAGLHVAGYISQFEETNPQKVAIDSLIENHVNYVYQSTEHAMPLSLMQQKMSAHASIIRNVSEMQKIYEEVTDAIKLSRRQVSESFIDFYRRLDAYYVAEAVLFACLDYAKHTPWSRGGFFIPLSNKQPIHPKLPWSCQLSEGHSLVQEIVNHQGSFKAFYREVHPIPMRDTWFETVWHTFNKTQKL